MNIKSISLISAIILPVLAGCATTPPIALSPVGPQPTTKTASGKKGYLQVFSATQKSPPVASDDTWSFDVHTGYDINDPSGKHIKFVANHATDMDESPDQVALVPGQYIIEAESTCCGLVDVPVVIEKGKTTYVHLDRNWWPPNRTPLSQIVFLPDGAAVGWTGVIAKSADKNSVAVAASTSH